MSAKKTVEDVEPLPENQATPNQIQKTLNAFIEETRKNFSDINGDREHDHEFVLTINKNLTALEGVVQNLSDNVKRLTEEVKKGNREVTKSMEDKVEEIKEEVAPKKIIIQQVAHFSVRLWFKNLFKRK